MRCDCSDRRPEASVLMGEQHLLHPAAGRTALHLEVAILLGSDDNQLLPRPSVAVGFALSLAAESILTLAIFGTTTSPSLKAVPGEATGPAVIAGAAVTAVTGVAVAPAGPVAAASCRRVPMLRCRLGLSITTSTILL